MISGIRKVTRHARRATAVGCICWYILQTNLDKATKEADQGTKDGLRHLSLDPGILFWPTTMRGEIVALATVAFLERRALFETIRPKYDQIQASLDEAEIEYLIWSLIGGVIKHLPSKAPEAEQLLP